jgi:hypothetical protein
MAVHEWFTDRRDYPQMESDAIELGVRTANRLGNENAPVRRGDVEEATAWRLEAVCFEASLAGMLATSRSRSR